MKQMIIIPLMMVLAASLSFSEAAYAGGAGPDLPSVSAAAGSDVCQRLVDAGNWPVTTAGGVEKLYGFFTVFQHPIGAFGNPDKHFSVHIKLERGYRDNTETGVNQYWFSFPTNMPTDWPANRNICKVRKNTIKTLYRQFACRYDFLEPFNLLDPGGDQMLLPVIRNLHIVQRDCQRPDGTQMIRGYVVLNVKIVDKPPPVVPAVKK